MVGENDEVVRTGHGGGCPLQASEVRINRAEHLKCIGPVNPRVMRDLVVGEKGRVNGRYPPEHVRDQHEEVGLLHERRRASTDERVLEMPVDTGAVVAAHLSPRLPPLSNDVANEERQGAGKSLVVCKMSGGPPRRNPLFVSNGAVGTKTIGRITGKDVPATGAAVCQ